MEVNRIKEILEKINKVKIAVYGDFCLDAYWHMDPEGSEVSVETGLKAESVAKQVYSPGGASNIVANLSALRPAAIKLVGVLGDDIHGRELLMQLEGLGADTTALVIQKENFATYTFTKKYYGDKEDPRIDFGLNNIRSAETDSIILENIEKVLKEYDALIFNQQVPGSITNTSFIDKANRLFEKYRDKIVIADSRHFNSSFKYVYRKVNEVEAAVLNGRDVSPQDYIPTNDIREYGKMLYSRYNKPVFITCGPRGIVSYDSIGMTELPGLQLLKKLDTVGAGDTTLSAISLCLAAGTEPAESAAFANLAAGVTVQKLFTTGAASGEEILALNKEADYVHRPELANDTRKAVYHGELELEICRKDILKRLGNTKHVLFDNDGTISTLRQGWEQIMEPVMIKAILGNSYKTADPGVYKEVRKQVLNFIDMSTGIQTILQMEGLVDMVKDYGIVPKDEILDKFGYKEIYNDALMEMVNKRIAKLKSGELDICDYTMKGSLQILEELKQKGVTIYLASGTDEQDVINEATALGYAEYFNGGVYGSQNDIKKYSKKMVIERIIKENNLSGEELVVFGDGPVELKESIKKGGIAIGVASDEIRRFGLNTEKRTRLIKSGADMIIPDFSQYSELLGLMFK